jgi:monofunctional biosynthetic peptidoglycan transglycosylase
LALTQLRSRHRPSHRRRDRDPSGLRRLWHGVGHLTAGLLGVVVGTVVALRFVDPPVSAFMLHARATAWLGGGTLVIEHRWAKPGCLPDAMRLAVLAAEDQRFPAHWGFDVDQIADALQHAQQGGRLRGASTLSQQTAKNLFLWPAQSWLRKALEAPLTLLLEVVWPKARILEVYLNVAEFGPGIYGVDAAARRYFGKAAVELTSAESALLAAVLPNPQRLRVDGPSAYLRQRQHWILLQMGVVAGLPGIPELLAAPPAAPRCVSVD